MWRDSFKFLAMLLVITAAVLQIGAYDSRAIDPVAGAHIFENKGCIGCHGPTLTFNHPEVNALSPMPVNQVASVLLDYRSGQRQHNAMNTIAEHLSDQEIANLSAFLGVN